MQRDAQSRRSLQRLYASLLPIALFCWLATLGGVGGTPRNHNAPLDDGAPLVVVALKTMQDTQRLLQGIAQPWHVEGILRLPGALGGKGLSSSSPGDGSSSSSSSRTSTGLHLRATLPLAWAVQRATAEHDAFSVADVRVFAVSFTYHRRTARDLAVPCSSGPLLATVPVEQLQRDNADAWALDMHFDEGALQDDRDDDAAEETEGLSSHAGPQGFVLSADDDLSQGNNYQDVPFPVGRYFVCAAVEVRTHPTSVHRHDDPGAAVERSAVPIASFDVFGWRIAGTPEEGPRRASVCTRRQHLGDVSASGVGRLSTSPVRCVIGLEGWFPFPDGAVVELRQGGDGDGDRALARRTTSFDAPWVSRVHLPVDTVVAPLAVNGGDGTQWVDVVTERSGGHVEQSPIALTVRAYHRGATARPLPPFGNGGAIVSNFSVSLPLLHLEVGGHVEVVDGMLDAPTADDVQHDDVDAPIPYNIRLVPQVNVASHPLLVIGSASGWVLELRIDAMECVEQSLGPCIALSQSAPPRHVPHALFHCPFDARGLWPSPPLDALEQQPGSLRLAAATIRCTTAAGVIVPIVVSELNDVDMHRTLVGGGGDGLFVVADPSTLRVWLYTLNHTIARAILAPSGISVVAMQSDTIRDGEPIGAQQAQGQSAVHEVAMPVHIENTTTTNETAAHRVEELRLSVFPWNHPWHHCSYLRVVVHGLPTAVDRYVPCGEFARRGRTVHAWPHAIRLATASAPQDAAPALIVGTIQRPGAPSHRADLLAEYSVRVQKHHFNVDQANLLLFNVTLTAHVAYVPATQTLRRSVSWDWSHWCGNSEQTISRSTQLSTDAVGGEDAEHDWVWSVTGSPAGVPVHANALASGRAFAAFCFSVQYRLGVYQQLLLVPVILVATPTVAPLTASLTMPCSVDGAGGDGEDGGGMPTAAAALCTQCFPGARLVRAPLRPRYDARMTHAADVSAFYFCTPSADTGRRDDASLVASDVLDNAGTALMRFHRPSLEALGRSTAADRDARFGPFALCVTINVTALVARHRAVSSMWQAFGLLHIDQAPHSEPAAGASLVPVHFGFATFTGCPTVQAVAIPPPAPLSVDALSEAWWAFFPTNTVQLQRALDAVTKGTAARSTHPSLATMLSRHPLRIVPFPQSLSGRDYIKRYKTHRLCVASASDHDASRRAAPVGNRRDAELLGDAVAQLYRTVRMEGAVGWLLRTRGPFYGDRALCANINGVEEYVGILSVPGPWYTAPLPMAPPNAAPIAEQARPSQLVFQRIVAVVDDPVRLSFSVVAHSSAEFLRSSLQLVRVEYIDQWGAILGAEQHVAPSAVGGDVLPDGNLDIVSPLHYEEVTRASVPSDVDRVVTATLVPHVPGTYVVCFAKGLAWDNTTKLVSGHQRSQPGKALAAAVRSTIERDASMEVLFDRQDGAVGAKRDEGSAGLHRQQLLDSLGVAAILGINRTATTRLPTLSDVKVATILEVLPPTRYDDGGAIKIRQHGGRTHVVVSSIAVARFRGVVGWATACVAPSIANTDVEGAHHPPVDVDALSSYQGVAPARSMIHLSDGALQLGFVLSPSNLCGRSRIVLLAGWRRVARAVRTPYRNQHAQRASVGMDDTVDTQRVVWRIVTRDLELPRGVLDHIAMAHRRAPPGEGATNDMDPPPSRSSLAACGGGSDAEACTTDAGSHSSIESTALFDALDLDLLDGI